MSGKIVKSCSESDKHEGDAICIVYHNGNIYSGGADGSIKIWDQDLNLKKDLIHHFGAYIYAIAVNYKGKLYSASNDGLVKFVENPLETTEGQNLMQSDEAVQCLYCDGDFLYTGDDIGVVTQWENDRILLKFNLVEEIKSLAVESNLIYTVRDLDVLVTEIISGSKSGRYSTRMTIDGKSPLTLCGPIVDGKREFLSFCTRDGVGLKLVDNKKGKSFAKIWTKENCHSMIINSICGTDKTLFSGGYDKMVKMWVNIDKECKLGGEINLESCINSICNGENDHTIYAATSDGYIRKVAFS
ncbi:probable serine/threonine-protein kinase roco4 [Condylostylus longicornis]|uniref:probable serine/threonine-protein kinase roco4 n=1 Tax=Condylostylus longicornis TaxID=2530218 RepID=UPI00244DF766|nr:probable serine/threonine-protein kinase roco4 [Condylostylus longicornis]